MSDLDTEDVSQAECNEQAGYACDERQQIVLLPNADHAFEELLAVEDPDPIQEHDQSGQPDRSYDLGFGCERTDGKANEKDRADAERESPDTDLTDQVAQSDREERRQYRLTSDDVASKVQHFFSPPGTVIVNAPGILLPGTAQ